MFTIFDLFKDIETYKGITPYASEHYGVYQPLLGWQSRLTKSWLSRGGLLVDPAVRSVLNGRLTPGPDHVQFDDPREFLALPLQPASGRSPWRVIVTKPLDSLLVGLVQGAVQAFVDSHAGALPDDAQWNQVIEFNSMMDPDQGLLRQVNDTFRMDLFRRLQARIPGGVITDTMRAEAKTEHLQRMQYESQIATFLLTHAEGQGGLNPNELRKLFAVAQAAPLDDIFRPGDPLANIDPNDTSGALSPVGFVHLFRQYFFDLGTFLGEPVEHIWLAPGTTIELIEVSTRRTIIERSEENAGEDTTRTEQNSSVKDELSDAVKSENSSSTKLGVSTTNTVSFGVYQGTATASFGVESTRREAREETHKENREQSEKLSSEIKRSFKSVFKTVTETTDTRSRRYLLQNPSLDLVNYELRRKMRRVGVQMQDLGTRLCWQVFIDDAGATLGLAELVHFAESPDLANLKQPDVGPPPAAVKKTFTVPVPFRPPPGHGNDDFGPGANYGDTSELGPEGFRQGHRINTNDEDAEDNRVIMGPFPFKGDPPLPNYELSEVRLIGPKPNQQAIARPPENINKVSCSFDLVMDLLNFGGQPVIGYDVDLVFEPTATANLNYTAAVAEAQKKFDAEVSRLRHKSFMESVRARIKDASNVRPRPSWDLREEERTVVYRKLIGRLMLDSWKLPDTDGNRRLSHVRSEVPSHLRRRRHAVLRCPRMVDAPPARKPPQPENRRRGPDRRPDRSRRRQMGRPRKARRQLPHHRRLGSRPVRQLPRLVAPTRRR